MYFVRAKYKIEDPIESNATLSMRFRTQDGKGWDDANSYVFFPPKSVKGEWGEIDGYFFTPPYEVRLIFQLGTAKSKGKVFFDNVELYRMK